MKGASGLLIVAVGVTLLYIAATGKWSCMKDAVRCLGSSGGGGGGKGFSGAG